MSEPTQRPSNLEQARSALRQALADPVSPSESSIALAVDRVEARPPDTPVAQPAAPPVVQGVALDGVRGKLEKALRILHSDNAERMIAVSDRGELILLVSEALAAPPVAPLAAPQSVKPINPGPVAVQRSLRDIASDVHACGVAWAPEARLIGNVRADEIAALAWDVLLREVAELEALRSQDRNAFVRGLNEGARQAGLFKPAPPALEGPPAERMSALKCNAHGGYGFVSDCTECNPPPKADAGIAVAPEPWTPKEGDMVWVYLSVKSAGGQKGKVTKARLFRVYGRRGFVNAHMVEIDGREYMIAEDELSPAEPVGAPRGFAVNDHESRYWRILVELGAEKIEIGGKPALDLRPIRITSGVRMGLFCEAFHEVAGRSGAVRRHVDRSGCPVFVVADRAIASERAPEEPKP